MVEKVSSFERFLALFHRVKAEAGGEPSRVPVFYDQKEALREAADALIRYVIWGDFKRRLLHSPKKWHPQVPEAFLAEWDDFEENWEATLLHSWLPIKLDLSNLEASEGDQQSSIAKKSPPARQFGPQQSEGDKPDPDEVDRFDPLYHDGGAAYEMAFWVAESYADEVGSDFENTSSRASRIGLEARDYLENTIGFDARTVFRRWREVPITYMPAHVSNKHGFSEAGKLMDLLDNAVRAYVFDAPAAAIAMCRATLEILLKEHYGLEYKYRNRAGEVRDKGLGELIVLADAEYEFVQGRRLQRLVNTANRIMHQAARREDLSTAGERIILEFLKTLKYLIQRAPR